MDKGKVALGGATYNVRVGLREQLERDLRHSSGYRDAPFRVCRRVGSDLDGERMPWEAEAACSQCTHPVVYSRKVSEGKVLVCLRCAVRARIRGHFRTELDPLDPMEATDASLNDSDFLRQMEISVSQHRHGEHVADVVANRPAVRPGVGVAAPDQSPNRSRLRQPRTRLTYQRAA